MLLDLPLTFLLKHLAQCVITFILHDDWINVRAYNNPYHTVSFSRAQTLSIFVIGEFLVSSRGFSTRQGLFHLYNQPTKERGHLVPWV